MDSKHWANDAVRALYANGLTFGDRNNNFNSEGKVTREQYASFLNRGIHLNKDFVPEPIPVKLVPKHGKKLKFVTAQYHMSMFDTSDGLTEVQAALDRRNEVDGMPTLTLSQWVDASNYVIKTGDIYIAPDYAYALYAIYENSRTYIAFAY